MSDLLAQLLVKLVNAKKIIEVGTFTGYSSTSMALALPEDGRIICCDVNETYTDIAKKYWKEAGVEGKIELHLRPAVVTLEELLQQGQEGTFDMGFIDADKVNYGKSGM